MRKRITKKAEKVTLAPHHKSRPVKVYEPRNKFQALDLMMFGKPMFA